MSDLLRVRGLQVAFGGKAVVHGVDFSIAPGEKLALVGESGSGKTVTALSLLRLVHGAQVSGVAQFASASLGEGGVDLLSMPLQALRGVRGREIAMIFQEPMTALNPLYTVGDQIAEVLQLKQGLGRIEAAQAAIELLADTGIPDPARRAQAFAHQLSGGQRQRAMIAMALACKPQLLLADEPTTALDVTVRGQILDLLTTLQRKHGMAVLLITHDLNLVRRFADRVLVMEAGVVVEQGAVEQVFRHPQHSYTQKLMDSKPRRLVALPGEPATQGEVTASSQAPVLSAQSLQVAYAIPLAGLRGWFKRASFVAVQGVNFALQTGRTLGVVGESGSGKSTLALAALGLLPCTGKLQVLGESWGQSAAADRALRQHVQVVFQDPFSSLSPRMTVSEIVGEGLRVHASHWTAAQRQERVLQSLLAVGLTPAQFPGLLQRYPHEFSGGQRQRLAIARALIVQPKVLVLDEPTSALDVTIQKQVLELLQRLQQEMGLSYLLITHDMDVIRAMAHDVLVLKDGVVVEAGPLQRVFDAPEQDYTRALLAAAA